MKQDGYEPDLIHACHNRTVVIDAHLGERENKQINVVEAHGLRNIHIYETEEWINIRDAVGDLTKKFICLNEVYPKGFMIPKRFIGENIIHLPTVKTHVFTTTTGAMKNAFGGLLNEHRHWTHPVIHETLVDLLMIQKKIHRGVFAVMDGTFAGDGPGPRCMMPYVKNVILASADQVAIDAVAAKLMGFDPLSIKFIRMAHEMGLGCGDPRDIEIVGDAEAGGRELALRRAVQEDDVRLADAAQDLLGPDEEADRVVPEDGARAVGLHRQRHLPRQLLVSGQREAHDARRARRAPGAGCSATGRPLTPDADGYPARRRATAREIELTGGKALRPTRSASSAPASRRRPEFLTRRRATGARRDDRTGIPERDALMSDFNVRSDTVDVEQIMRQIRSRIREKRGVDYTEDEIRELANVKLEKFLDPQAACGRTCSSSSAAISDAASRRRRTTRSRTHALRDAPRADPVACAALLQPDPEAVLQSQPAHPGAAHPGRS